MKLHVIFGSLCILYALASVTILIVSYAALDSAWMAGPPAANDNFEVGSMFHMRIHVE